MSKRRIVVFFHSENIKSPASLRFIRRMFIIYFGVVIIIVVVVPWGGTDTNTHAQRSSRAVWSSGHTTNIAGAEEITTSRESHHVQCSLTPTNGRFLIATHSSSPAGSRSVPRTIIPDRDYSHQWFFSTLVYAMYCYARQFPAKIPASKAAMFKSHTWPAVYATAATCVVHSGHLNTMATAKNLRESATTLERDSDKGGWECVSHHLAIEFDHSFIQFL